MSAQAYREAYPGFPPFVHQLMQYHREGMDPREAAEKVGATEIQNAIARSITLANRTRPTYGPDGTVVLPDPVPMDIDE